MKRTIYLTFTSVLVALSAVAQEPPREVVVTRDYEPDVSTFQKLDFAPRDLDTAALQPDMDYSIKPVPLTPDMPLHVAEPEKMDVSQRILTDLGYLRLGFGLPISSLVNFWITDQHKTHISTRFRGFYLNNDGNYASVKNDAGENRSAMGMRNDFALFFAGGDDKNWASLSINTMLNIYNPYGQFTPVHIAPETDTMQNIDHISMWLDLMAFDREKGTTKLKIGLYGTETYNRVDSDAIFFIDYDLSLKFKIGNGELHVGVPINYENEANSDFRLGVVPSYEFRLMDIINLNLGAQLLYNYHGNLANRLYFYPIVEADMVIEHGAKWYASWTGELGNSNIRLLTQQNPYLNAGDLNAKNSSLNRFKTGIRGSAAQIVTYDVFAGGDIWRDYVYFVSRPTGLFDVRNVDVVNNYYVGAAVAVQPFVGLEFSANGRYNYFDPMPEIGTAIPRWQAGLKAKYSYRNRFFVGLGADFLGERRFATADTDDISGLGIDVIPNSINLSADIEARISRSVNVFVRGENLLNKRIETFNHYFIPGASVIAGVKIVF